MTKAAKCVCMHASVNCLNMKLMSFPLKTFSEAYQANISSPQKTFNRLNLHQRFNRRLSSLFPLRENPVTLKRPPGPASALFVVTGRVCCTDAPSACKGAPDVWKKRAGVRRQLPTQKEGMCGRQLKESGVEVHLYPNLSLASRQAGFGKALASLVSETSPKHKQAQAHKSLRMSNVRGGLRPSFTAQFVLTILTCPGFQCSLPCYANSSLTNTF